MQAIFLCNRYSKWIIEHPEFSLRHQLANNEFEALQYEAQSVVSSVVRAKSNDDN